MTPELLALMDHELDRGVQISSEIRDVADLTRKYANSPPDAELATFVRDFADTAQKSPLVDEFRTMIYAEPPTTSWKEFRHCPNRNRNWRNNYYLS